MEQSPAPVEVRKNEIARLYEAFATAGSSGLWRTRRPEVGSR